MPQTMPEWDRGEVEPPIDLVHLTRQTLGHHHLRQEVLGLFLSHTSSQLALLRSADTKEDRRAIAHSINGAARGIGAWKVARIAGTIEADGVGAAEVLEALTSAIEAARAHIVVLIDDDGHAGPGTRNPL